jgi:hypothetical protein
LCVSVGIFPMSTQNFITARCSTFSANVPFFSNADPVFSASNPYFSETMSGKADHRLENPML